ncbi:hypothetical protein K504DRAFT_259157 [Pleomassaria siparia CBS 279.74]|uniref:Uncharacterized protein n=1 Tax=Pleomassaria siparia CBS 279.74 TaxID=1314801 RepID=A0A6G1KC08_9PLEO|nr:hypothetical protein K504DRAFT_259157 [Pleomassaria siparia CBS 279.74]
MTSESTPDKVAAAIGLDANVEDIDNQLTSLPDTIKVHDNFRACVPPNAPDYGNPEADDYSKHASIFLAGSIEMGNAIQWQPHLTKLLSPLDITVCNPRRGTWGTGKTKEERDEQFSIQVEWELCALERVDVICFFFDKNTLSPVTMLELGLWAHSGKVVVCCDKDFWKAGNIHHVCNKYNVPFVKHYADLLPLIQQKLEHVVELKDFAGEKLTEEKAKRAALNVETAHKLKHQREAKEDATVHTPESEPTIHQYRKYLRPARVAFDADNVNDSTQKQAAWNKLCGY